MVENTPHIGFRVTQPDFAKYTDVFAVRQLLEGESGSSERQRTSLKRNWRNGPMLEEMNAATQAGEMELLTKLNYQFHHLVYSSCGNSTLVRLVEQVWSIYPAPGPFSRWSSAHGRGSPRTRGDIPSHKKWGLRRGSARPSVAQQRSYDLLVNCLVEDQDALENAG